MVEEVWAMRTKPLQRVRVPEQEDGTMASETDTVAKVVRDGMVAVVISGDYGGGWGRFEDDAERDLMMFHPDLVVAVEDKDDEAVLKWIRTHVPDSYYADSGCPPRLTIAWIPQGVEFIVEEYDGAEWVLIKQNVNWIKA
jgi:hypothetical protein